MWSTLGKFWRGGLSKTGGEGRWEPNSMKSGKFTQKVARHHWSTNEQQIYILGEAPYEGKGPCELLPCLQEAQVWQWHLPVSFSSTKENIFYVPSQHIFFLSPPLPSHPYSCHLTSSGPTLTHFFKNQASNSILSFSSALGYISYLTKMFLYHDHLYFSLKWIMNRSPSLFFLCSSWVIA